MRISTLLVGFIALVMLAMSPVMAVTQCSLDIAQKDTTTTPYYTDLNNGVEGTMTYAGDGSPFTFTGTGLTAGVEYTLISYQEPYPGTGSAVLGSAVAGTDGTITITGTTNFVDNTYLSGEYAGQNGAKIWLVKSADFTGGQLTTWENAPSYLFETRLVASDEVCGESEPSADGDVEVTGSIVRKLSIESSVNTIAFGDFVVGDNQRDNLGTLTVVSEFVPNWRVSAATTDGYGFMRINGGTVGTQALTNPLYEYDYLESAWENANDFSFDGTASTTMSQTFKQPVLISDEPGAYSTVITYTIAQV